MKGAANLLPAAAFHDATLRIPIGDIIPLRETNAAQRATIKYAQIAASISEVGIIEPPVVIPLDDNSGRYRLLDGHLRVDVLRHQSAEEVVCLIATEDEAFTYNRRISRLAIIQEHKMIVKVLNKGVPAERLARALNLNIDSIRKKRTLLTGICPEAVDLLRDKFLAANAFGELRKLKPMRQIAAAEMMVAMNCYTAGYIKSIVAATPDDQLVVSKRQATRGLSEAQVALMTEEAAQLDREFKLIEQTYGSDHLDLVLAAGYIGSLLGNARIVRHMALEHGDLLNEFQRIAELQRAA